jgi:cytochrome P450
MNAACLHDTGLPPFDPLRPGFLAENYRIFDEYRSKDPVHWSGCPTGRRGRWFVFDHRSAVTVLSDKRFCRQSVPASGGCPVALSPGVDRDPPPQDPTRPKPFGPGAFPAMVSDWMLFQDPPRHTRLRAAVTPKFTVPAAQALRPTIERRVQELLEPLARFETFDLIKQFAFPLPLDIISEVLGVDASERLSFRAWSGAMRDALDRPKWGSDALVRAEAATMGLREYFEAAWRRHRTSPDSGVLSALLSLEGREAGLSKDEAFATFTFLISAGHETTTNLIASGMYLLSQHPGERQRLLEDPSLIPRAVEEILRFESPVQMAARNVTAEIKLGTRQLLPGQRVEVMLGAANRDPAVFDAPDRFDVGRKPNPHLSFGLGSHYCVGASLGRLVGAIALPMLLERIRVQEFAPGSIPWTASVGFRGLTHLPCIVGEP